MEKLDAVLAELAGKLGVTIEHLYGVMLKQAEVAFWQTLIAIAMSIIAIFVFYRIVKAGLKPSKKYDGDIVYEDETVQCVLLWILTAIFGMVSIGALLEIIFGIMDLITLSVNPEYWALEEILSKLK